MRYVLGLDLGTSSLKAVLLDETGSPATGSTRGYPVHAPRPGWAEQDPESWLGACYEAIADLLARTGATAKQIVAITTGGQMHGTVLLDGTGAVLRPAIIWPDQRTVDEAVWAERLLAARNLLPGLGGGISPGFMLASLLWCRLHEPETWQRVATALLPKDYLRYRLTGTMASESSDGTGIPALDLTSWHWSDEALQCLGLSTKLLPPLMDSTAIAGTLSDEAARACSLQAGTPVICGGSDQAMGAIGAGLLWPGTLLISISTGGQLVTPIIAPLADPAHGLRTLCHALPQTSETAGMGRYLALSATLGAGLSLRWLRETVFDRHDASGDLEIVELAATVPDGAGGLLFLPYLAGERAPLLDPAASGALIGLRLDHGRAHLARAVLEGIAFSLRHALEPLQRQQVHVEHIILAGGLAGSTLMRTILAGVLGQTVTPLNGEGPRGGAQSAIGAAILAGVHAGFFGSLEQACTAVVRLGAAITPDHEQATRYDALYARYRVLYPALVEHMHALR